MTWVKIDDQFPDHPKLVEAGPLAGWLHICALCYASRYLTDGFIPAGQVRRLADVDNPMQLADRLVEVGVWKRTDNGFIIHDYLEYQPSAEKVKAEREAAKQRMKQKRSGEVQPNTERTEDEHREKFNDPVPVPVPDVPNGTKTPTTTSARARKKLPVTPEIAETADVLGQAHWINDEPSKIEQAVARSFQLVEGFSPRDGPFEAEQFARHWAKEPPSDWYRSWLNWIKNAVRFAREAEQRPSRNGRSSRDTEESPEEKQRRMAQLKQERAFMTLPIAERRKLIEAGKL